MTIHIIDCVKTCQREQGNTFVQHFNMQNTVDQFLNSFILSFYGGGGGGAGKLEMEKSWFLFVCSSFVG